jgi:hypothetical protein
LTAQPTPDTPPLADARASIFAHLRDSNSHLIAVTNRIRTLKEESRVISKQIQDNRYVGADKLRRLFAHQIASVNYSSGFHEAEVVRLKANIELLAQFHSYLEKVTTGKAFVNVPAFLATLTRQSQTEVETYKRRRHWLRSLAKKPVKVPQPDPKDTFDFFFHPAQKSGQIIQRISDNIGRVLYADLESIIDALFETCRDKEVLTKHVITDLIFDYGWGFRTYPFCPPFMSTPIPSVSLLIPKVFDPPFLDDEWSMQTFGELAKSVWPLKEAVDELFGIAVLTNPFEIADRFFEIIQTIGRCVQRILARKAKNKRFPEMDFDQIFVLMLVSILTSGLSELPLVMTYSFSFREFVKADAHKQYAMSHMEGLCAHLSRLDYTELRKKSNQLQECYSATVIDPLGILR